MSSGDKRIGTSGDSMPFGSKEFSVGPLLIGIVALVFPVYVPVGMGTIRVKKVRSVVTVALAGGSATSVTTIKNKTTAMTGGTLTIANAATVAEEDYCDIVNDANARVAEGDYIALAIAARSSGSAGEAVFSIEYEPCQ